MFVYMYVGHKPLIKFHLSGTINKSVCGEEHTQKHLHQYCLSEDHDELLKDVVMTFVDKTDTSDPHKDHNVLRFLSTKLTFLDWIKNLKTFARMGCIMNEGECIIYKTSFYTFL